MRNFEKKNLEKKSLKSRNFKEFLYVKYQKFVLTQTIFHID